MLDQAGRMVKRDRVFAVCFSGGEPFLNFTELAAMIARASRNGARVSCVTNGFWAVSAAAAREKLAVLKRAGLDNLVISTDKFHQRFVPLAKVRTVIAACRELGIGFGLKYVVTKNGPRLTSLLRQLEDVTAGAEFKIQEIPCLPAGRARELPAAAFRYQRGLPGKRCPGQGMLTIDPSGIAYPCCPPAWPKRLGLGDARTTPLAVLAKKAATDPLLKLLRREGPAFLVPYLELAGTIFARGRFVEECHLCQAVMEAIASDPALEQAVTRAIRVGRDACRLRRRAADTVLALFAPKQK